MNGTLVFVRDYEGNLLTRTIWEIGLEKIYVVSSEDFPKLKKVCRSGKPFIISFRFCVIKEYRSLQHKHS